MATKLHSSRAIKNAQEHGVFGLAWVSFLLALAGGSYADTTFIGGLIRGAVGMFPDDWHVAGLILLAAVVTVFIDLFLDLTPNWPAVGAAIIGPSVASMVNARLGSMVSGWAQAMQDSVGEKVGEFVGGTTAVGLALACILASLLTARRVIKKSGGGGPVRSGGAPMVVR
jgi:hypothetical protein